MFENVPKSKESAVLRVFRAIYTSKEERWALGNWRSVCFVLIEP